MVIVAKVLKKEELDALQDGVTVVPTGVPIETAKGVRKGRVVPRVLVEAYEEARAIVQRARDEADSLRTNAAARLEEERARAVEAARQEELSTLANLRLSLEREVNALPNELAERATAATLLVIERFLRKGASPEDVRALFLSALEEVRSTRSLSIECAVNDENTLREALKEHFGHEGEAISIRANETLAQGDLLLSSLGGTIDARIPTRIERLAPVILSALRGTNNDA